MTNRYQYRDEVGQHMHLLDGQPLYGTSSVAKILAKPLSYWAAGLAVQVFGCPDAKVLTKIKRGTATSQEKTDMMSALRVAHQTIIKMTDEQYVALIDQAYRAHATTLKEKAVAGTDLHAELERFVLDHMSAEQYPRYDKAIYDPKITPFIEWSHANVKRFLWSEGHCYSEQYWLGGICDAGYEHNDGHYGIIDFKSAKDAYPEHFWQCAGYDIQLTENGVFDAQGNLRYKLQRAIDRYCVVPFGAKEVYPRFYESPETGQRVFLAMLEIYKEMPKE